MLGPELHFPRGDGVSVLRDDVGEPDREPGKFAVDDLRRDGPVRVAAAVSVEPELLDQIERPARVFGIVGEDVPEVRQLCRAGFQRIPDQKEVVLLRVTPIVFPALAKLFIRGGGEHTTQNTGLSVLLDGKDRERRGGREAGSIEQGLRVPSEAARVGVGRVDAVGNLCGRESPAILRDVHRMTIAGAKSGNVYQRNAGRWQEGCTGRPGAKPP